ncbi:MAG TPA: cytochrome C oxidase subunit IV family protein [Terriglobales bacterium]|jgi:cytochrome c oxidase subunit IV
MDAAGKRQSGLATYFVVYVFILALAGIQVLLAYQHVQGEQLVFRMLAVAIVQAILAVTFFMHMRYERRTLIIALFPATLFVLLMMNMIWSDSFRLIHK